MSLLLEALGDKRRLGMRSDPSIIADSGRTSLSSEPRPREATVKAGASFSYDGWVLDRMLQSPLTTPMIERWMGPA